MADKTLVVCEREISEGIKVSAYLHEKELVYQLEVDIKASPVRSGMKNRIDFVVGTTRITANDALALMLMMNV